MNRFDSLPTRHADARVPLRIVLLSIAMLWLSYFLLITARGLVVGIDFQSELLARRALVTLVGMAVTLGLWLLLRLFDRRSLMLQIGAAVILAMPAAVLIAQTNQVVFAAVERRVEEKFAKERGFSLRRNEAGNLVIEAPVVPSEDSESPLGAEPGAPTAKIVLPGDSAQDRLATLVELALGRYFLLIAWAAIYFALLAGARAFAAEREGERLRTAAKASELRSLRYQVNPHFLFNTLNSLSALVMTGKADSAERMIQTLSRFYRQSLADDPTSDVSLADEIALQEHYLDIEMVRFPERLRVHVDMPAALAECRVPGMILQPLVENSVKYGVSASASPVTIAIVAREEYDRLVLCVSDDGPGAAPGLNAEGFGIGLTNVRDRLRARFGAAASVTSGPTERGYMTELRLPLVRHG